MNKNAEENCGGMSNSKLKSTRTPGTTTDSDLSYTSEDWKKSLGHATLRRAYTNDSCLSLTTSENVSAVDKFEAHPQSIKLEHVIQTKQVLPTRKRAVGTIFGVTKVTMFIAAFLFLITGGVGLLGWLKIPGLNNQIKKLEKEVNALSDEIDRLSNEINRLEDQNDRFQALNGQLNRTVVDFENLTGDLNSTVDELEDVSDELNVTSQELQSQVNNLAVENEQYAKLNQDLNTTKIELLKEMIVLQDTTHILRSEKEQLSNLTDKLQYLNENLGNLTDVQQASLTELEETLSNITIENDRLEILNNDLITIVSFLNSTAFGLNDSFEQLTSMLSNQIAINQNTVLSNVQYLYRQKTECWFCDYSSIFHDQPWGKDYDTPITNITKAMQLVNDRVLDELCLDPFDYEAFLFTSNEDNGGNITSNELRKGVIQYTKNALDYYFPESDEVGLTMENWSDADYICDNLENKYLWNVNHNIFD